ncbi:MAG: hypothetical protein QGH15_18735 [Kiritimatiellia bacterium]|jgi:hypothetical protein|nr:hypothetical protein [Kiritimatiellia bacterium]
MVTIVRSKKTNERYVLLDAGFGASKSLKPHWFFGDVIADSDSDHSPLLTVANAAGEIGWFNPGDLIVESIDGTPISEFLGREAGDE